MTDWLDALTDLALQADIPTVHPGKPMPAQASVLVSVVRTRGSCPREVGTRMVVTPGQSHGTIGGGHLEFKAMQIARERLIEGSPGMHIERFVLGARLGQCCGGEVHLSFEPLPAEAASWVLDLQRLCHGGKPLVLVTQARMHDPRRPLIPRSDACTGKLIITRERCIGRWADSLLQRRAVSRARALLDLPGTPTMPATGMACWEAPILYEPLRHVPPVMAVFGAGHVGKALVRVLGTLPCRLLWVDSRADEFPHPLPGGVQMIVSDEPEDEIDRLPAGSQVVIMTHSHALDQRLCERALRRIDLGWCGVIGSMAKRRRFDKRLLARGLPAEAVARLVCPIGVADVPGKHPGEIAIAVAAELLQARSRKQTPAREALLSGTSEALSRASKCH